jgi:hypothetical protein
MKWKDVIIAERLSPVEYVEAQGIEHEISASARTCKRVARCVLDVLAEPAQHASTRIDAAASRGALVHEP